MMTAMDFLSGFAPVLAQAAPEGAAGSGVGMGTWVWMGLLFVGMWFLVVAPQRKAQKQHNRLIDGLKKGDRIITKGGFYGRIVSVKKDRVVIQIAEGTKVELVKASVASVLGETADGKTQEEAIEEDEEKQA